MKIAILGCGAIGGLFLGYFSQKGFDVSGVVRDYQKEPLLRDGLLIEGVRGDFKIPVKVDTKLNQPVDLVIFATKINNLQEVINDNYEFVKEASVLSTQNGIRADYILGDYFAKEKIITTKKSKVKVLVVPTNEELMIARETYRLMK